MNSSLRSAFAAILIAALAASVAAADGASAARRVDGAFIQSNARTTRDWPSYGLDYAESRFSKLTQINAGNAKDLGLVWAYDLESTRGVEATPLFVDGVMYVTAALERGARHRRPDRQAPVDIRPRGAALRRATKAAATS